MPAAGFREVVLNMRRPRRWVLHRSPQQLLIRVARSRFGHTFVTQL